LAVSLIKIANDLRWLASGRRCAIGEIESPDTQPVRRSRLAKSIRFSVNGHQRRLLSSAATRRVRFAATRGNFELNVTMPVVTLKLLEAIEFTANALSEMRHRHGGERTSVRNLVEKSLAMVTALFPVIVMMPPRPLPMKRYNRNTVREWRGSRLRLLRSNSKKLWPRGA